MERPQKRIVHESMIELVKLWTNVTMISSKSALVV